MQERDFGSFWSKNLSIDRCGYYIVSGLLVCRMQGDVLSVHISSVMSAKIGKA